MQENIYLTFKVQTLSKCGAFQEFPVLSAWRSALVFLDQHSHHIHLQQEVAARVSLFFFPQSKKVFRRGKKVRGFVRCSAWVHFISEVRQDLYSQNLSEPNPSFLWLYSYQQCNWKVYKESIRFVVGKGVTLWNCSLEEPCAKAAGTKNPQILVFNAPVWHCKLCLTALVDSVRA